MGTIQIRDESEAALNDITIAVFKQLERQRQVLISRITGDNADIDVDMCVDRIFDMDNDCSKIYFMNDVEKWFLLACNFCKSACIYDPVKIEQFVINSLPSLATADGELCILAQTLLTTAFEAVLPR